MTLMLIFFIVSLLWLIMGSLINKIQAMWLTEPMIALFAGVLAGPLLKIIEIPENSEQKVLEWGAMITIAMALMAAALKFRHKYIMEHKQMLSVLVLGGMLLMFGLSAVVAKFALGLEWSIALLIGAIITPTDPVVSASMISGKFAEKLLNNNIRSSLYFESGINDGLAMPLVAIGWMLVGSGEIEWMRWITKVVLFENVLASLIGAVTGYVAGFVMHHARKAKLMTEKTLVSYSIGLAFLVLSLLELLNMNGIIGVFCAGLLFNRAIKQEEDLEEERIQDAMERLVTIPVFFLLGLVLPWKEWLEMGLPLVLFAAGILLFRRLPAVILLKPFLKQISRWPRVLVVGWFGPVGVAALLYALLSVKQVGFVEGYHVVTAVIVASVVIHGVTSIPFSQLYRKHDTDDVEGDSDDDNVEEDEDV